MTRRLPSPDLLRGPVGSFGAELDTDEAAPSVPFRGQGSVVAPDQLPAPALRRRSDPPLEKLELSPRELEVLRLYPYARNWKEVGAILRISAQTVRNHVTNAYWKLGADNAIDAYVRLGWLRVPKRDE